MSSQAEAGKMFELSEEMLAALPVKLYTATSHSPEAVKRLDETLHKILHGFYTDIAQVVDAKFEMPPLMVLAFLQDDGELIVQVAVPPLEVFTKFNDCMGVLTVVLRAITAQHKHLVVAGVLVEGYVGGLSGGRHEVVVIRLEDRSGAARSLCVEIDRSGMNYALGRDILAEDNNTKSESRYIDFFDIYQDSGPNSMLALLNAAAGPVRH